MSAGFIPPAFSSILKRKSHRDRPRHLQFAEDYAVPSRRHATGTGLASLDVRNAYAAEVRAIEAEQAQQASHAAEADEDDLYGGYGVEEATPEEEATAANTRANETPVLRAVRSRMPSRQEAPKLRGALLARYACRIEVDADMAPEGVRQSFQKVACAIVEKDPIDVRIPAGPDTDPFLAVVEPGPPGANCSLKPT